MQLTVDGGFFLSTVNCYLSTTYTMTQSSVLK
jgi:hypothetical protein